MRRSWNWENVLKDPKKLKILGEMAKTIHKIGGHVQSKDIEFSI